MAKKRWKLLEEAPEGFAAVEVGDEFDGDYTHDEEKAIVAAGWVELVEEKKSKEANK